MKNLVFAFICLAFCGCTYTNVYTEGKAAEVYKCECGGMNLFLQKSLDDQIDRFQSIMMNKATGYASQYYQFKRVCDYGMISYIQEAMLKDRYALMKYDDYHLPKEFKEKIFYNISVKAFTIFSSGSCVEKEVVVNR